MLSKKDVDRIADAVAEKLAPHEVTVDSGVSFDGGKLQMMVDNYISGFTDTESARRELDRWSGSRSRKPRLS